MLVEAPLGNLGADVDPSTVNEPVDWLDLTWSQSLQRAIRKTTRGGAQVRILARLGVQFQHGDVLRHGAGHTIPTIAINVVPCEVVIATPRDADAQAALCYELGNLHVPVQLLRGQVITITDGPVIAAMERLNIEQEPGFLRFTPCLVGTTELTVSKGFRITPAM